MRVIYYLTLIYITDCQIVIQNTESTPNCNNRTIWGTRENSQREGLRRDLSSCEKKA